MRAILKQERRKEGEEGEKGVKGKVKLTRTKTKGRRKEGTRTQQVEDNR